MSESVSPSLAPAEFLLVSRKEWQEGTDGYRTHSEDGKANIGIPLTVNTYEDVEVAYKTARWLVKTWMLAGEAYLPLDGAIRKFSTHNSKGSNDNLVVPGIDHPVDKDVDPRVLYIGSPVVQEIVRNRGLGKSHQKLVESWPHFSETYSRAIRKGIKLGYIPGDVLERTEVALRHTGVRVIDSALLRTIEKNTTSVTAACYDLEDDEIWINHTIYQETEADLDVEAYLMHEFIHKVAGGTFVVQSSDPSESWRERSGFTTEVEPDEGSRVGLNEAVTEHITQAIRNGDFETIDPEYRGEKKATYRAYRNVLAAFIGRSQGIIDMRTLVSAYFEDTGPAGSTFSRRRLLREVSTAYGFGALNKLDRLMKLSDGLSQRDIAGVCSRIHAPILDAQGNVTSPGFLDMGGLYPPSKIKHT